MGNLFCDPFSTFNFLQDSSAQPIAKPTDEIQTVSVIPFFETDNLLFTRTLLIIVTSLVICVISGLSFHFIWSRLNPKQGKRQVYNILPSFLICLATSKIL